MKMKFEGTISEYRRMLDLQPIIEGVTSFFESLSKDYGFEERLGQATPVRKTHILSVIMR